MCTSSSNKSIVLHQYYAFIWKVFIRCCGLVNTVIATIITKDDMLNIITWLLGAALKYKPPSNTSIQMVSDSDYLLFSLLLKPHLSEKGQSSHGVDVNVDFMGPLATELKRLRTVPYPGAEFVGACCLTCHESG
jgi:hypothetical protein